MRHIIYATIALISYIFVGFAICYILSSIIPFRENQEIQIFMGLLVFYIFLIASIILSKIDDLKHDK